MNPRLRRIALAMSALALLFDVALMLKQYLKYGHVATETKQLGLGLLCVVIVNLYLVRKISN